MLGMEGVLVGRGHGGRTGMCARPREGGKGVIASSKLRKHACANGKEEQVSVGGAGRRRARGRREDGEVRPPTQRQRGCYP
jgi:hypothetical protein